MIRIINENTQNMTVQEFTNNVTSTYAKYFPHSKCLAKLYRNLGKTIRIECFLAGDKHELINGYWDNDMFKISFSIDLDRSAEDTSELPETIVLECDSHYYLTKPDVSYMAYGSKNVPFRKVTGSPVKCLTALDKFFSRLKTSVVNDLHNDTLHSTHTKLVRHKIS